MQHYALTNDIDLGHWVLFNNTSLLARKSRHMEQLIKGNDKDWQVSQQNEPRRQVLYKQFMELNYQKNNLVKHNSYYKKNSVFTKIRYMFQPKRHHQVQLLQKSTKKGRSDTERGLSLT